MVDTCRVTGDASGAAVVPTGRPLTILDGMEQPWPGSVRAFADAAEWFSATVGHVDDRWERVALGEWDVRALVGHTSRSLLTVEGGGLGTRS